MVRLSGDIAAHLWMQARLLTYGYNRITPPPQLHWLTKFVLTLFGGFQLMLWFGGTLCFIVYGISVADIPDNQTLALAIVLFLVIFVTSIFQSFQEGKSDKVIDALKALSASEVLALRDGAWKDHVPADELVPGDIVKVKGGDKVPADMRVLESADLKVLRI